MQRDQNALYFEYQGNIGGHIFVSAGARHDDNEDFGSHTSTRLSGAWLHELSADVYLRYRVSYGTGFRAPSLFETTYNRGPFAFPPAAMVTLTEESSKGIDVGIEYARRNGLQLELTWFDQDIEDEIFFDLTGFSGYLQSSGRSRSMGLEFATRVPVSERIELLANWTRNEAEDTTNAQRLRRPKMLANVGFAYRAGDDRVRLIANYRVSRDAIDIGNVPLDNYEVLDLSVTWKVFDSIELHARIENATDEAYQEIIGFNTAGRSAYAGIRVDF